jgi:hypothetical protein
LDTPLNSNTSTKNTSSAFYIPIKESKWEIRRRHSIVVDKKIDDESKVSYNDCETPQSINNSSKLQRFFYGANQVQSLKSCSSVKDSAKSRSNSSSPSPEAVDLLPSKSNFILDTGEATQNNSKALKISLRNKSNSEINKTMGCAIKDLMNEKILDNNSKPLDSIVPMQNQLVCIPKPVSARSIFVYLCQTILQYIYILYILGKNTLVRKYLFRQRSGEFHLILIRIIEKYLEKHYMQLGLH